MRIKLMRTRAIFDVHIFLNSQLHAFFGYNVTGLKYYTATNDKKTCSFQSPF